MKKKKRNACGAGIGAKRYSLACALRCAALTCRSVAELARGTKAPLTSERCGEAQPPASSAAVASVNTRASRRAGLWGRGEQGERGEGGS